MRHPHSPFHPAGRLYCSLCGRELPLGEEYWACNGSRICADCLPAFARQEFLPCHEIRGEECRYDTV